MSDANLLTNPIDGEVSWAPVKSLWFTFHALVAVIGSLVAFRLDAVMASCAFTVLTLALGHSIGLHRLLIHRSIECPLWLERLVVHLGTVVGMSGQFRILYMHDIRDWVQRHDRCHAVFITLTLVIFGTLTWRFAFDLSSGSRDFLRWFACGAGFFWALRCVMQWTHYSTEHWRGIPSRTAIHWIVFLSYGAFAATYLTAGLK